MTDGTPGDITELDVENVSPEDIDFDRLRDAMSHEEGLVRTRALDICLTFADESIETVLPLLPSIIEALSDDNVNVALKAATILNLIATDRPAELEAATGPLVDSLRHDLPRVQVFTARACQSIGVEYPEWFIPHVDGLLAAIRAEITDPTEGDPEMIAEEASDAVQRQYGQVSLEEQQNQLLGHAVATNLLVEVADRDPSAVIPYASDLVEIYATAHPNVAADVADAIATVAQADPTAFDDATDALCERLDSDTTVLVARSARALGFLGDTAAIEPLRTVAADESRDDDLRDLAAETADWLEANA